VFQNDYRVTKEACVKIKKRTHIHDDRDQRRGQCAAKKKMKFDQLCVLREEERDKKNVNLRRGAEVYRKRKKKRGRIRVTKKKKKKKEIFRIATVPGRKKVLNRPNKGKKGESVAGAEGGEGREREELKGKKWVALGGKKCLSQRAEKGRN